MKLFYFDRCNQASNKALYFGCNSMDQAWIANIVSRSSAHYDLLIRILRQEKAEFKADYLTKIFQKTNPSNADFKNRISWSLSKLFFKQSVKRLESNDIKNANLAIQKAMQMIEASNEFSENTKKNFPFMKPFKNKNKRDRNF